MASNPQQQLLPAGCDMASFLTPLDIEPEHISIDDQLWTVMQPLKYQSDLVGLVVVPVGFKTDLVSVPRIPIVYELCGGTSNEAAVVHDWLYSTHPCSRKTADAVLREASEASGVPRWRRTLMWAGVRLFGGSHW
jgi:hypothetical protein